MIRRAGCGISLNMSSKWAILVAVLAGFAAMWFFVRRDRGSDTIEYRGERIKLSRRYDDFSTYKNSYFPKPCTINKL
jgi:hypothetical protein